MGTGGAGCARTPAWSRSGCGCGCQLTWPLIDPLKGSRRTLAQQEQRILGLRSSEPGGVHKDDGGCRFFPTALEVIPGHSIAFALQSSALTPRPPRPP